MQQSQLGDWRTFLNEKLGIYFDNKGTVLELSGCTVEVYPSNGRRLPFIRKPNAFLPVEYSLDILSLEMS